MNGATGLKSVVAAAGHASENTGPKGCSSRNKVCIAGVWSLPAVAFAQSPCTGIHVNSMNMKTALAL